MTSALGALLGPLGMLIFLLLASIFAGLLHSLWQAVNSLQVHHRTTAHTHTAHALRVHCTHAHRALTTSLPPLSDLTLHVFSLSLTVPHSVSLTPLTAEEEEGNIHTALTTHTHTTLYHIPHIAHCTLHIAHACTHAMHVQVAFKEEKQTKLGAAAPPESPEAIDSDEEEAPPPSRRNSKEKQPPPRGPSAARPKPRLHRPSSLIRPLYEPDGSARPAWSAPPSGRCSRRAHAMAARSDSLDLGEQDDAELQAAVERARWSAGGRGPPPPPGSQASSI